MVSFKVADTEPATVEIRQKSMYRAESVDADLPEDHYLLACKAYTNGNCGKLLQQSEWDKSTSETTHNGFVNTVSRAYNQHHKLVLRPDDVWLAITTQFSAYVNGNAEELRSKFVGHSGKKQLVAVQMATLTTADYGKLARDMTTKLKAAVNDDELADWLLPNFSTTTVNDTIVGSVVFMASVQEYFRYIFALRCGIPEVTMLGTVEDWKLIHERVEFLRKFSPTCVKWADMLKPVTGKFVSSAEGKPDIDWWQRVCSNAGGGSGPSYLCGWITTFCVFNTGGQWQGDNFTAESHIRTRRKVSEFPVIDTLDIPAGYVTVPVTIDDSGTEYKSLMFAGHLNTEKIDKTTVAPQLNWAIVLKN